MIFGDDASSFLRACHPVAISALGGGLIMRVIVGLAKYFGLYCKNKVSIYVCRVTNWRAAGRLREVCIGGYVLIHSKGVMLKRKLWERRQQN